MLRTPSPVQTLIRRELLTTLRSWKSLLLLLFLLGLLYFFSFMILDEVSNTYFAAAQAMQSIFSFQMGLLLFAAMTFVPAMAALGLARERLDGSYDLLLTTLIPPSRIVLGKLAATLILFGLLVVALLPFTGLVFFFAGVDVYRFFSAMAAILPTALGCAAIGLFLSTCVENMVRALFLSFIAVFVLNLLLPGMMSWLLRSEFYMVLMCPFPLFTGRAGLATDGMVLALYPAFEVFIAVIATAGACFRLGRANRVGLVTSVAQRVLPQRQKAARFHPMTSAQNPIAMRDQLGSYLGRRSTMRSVFWLVAVIYGMTLFGFYQKFDFYVVLGAVYLERLLAFVLLPPIVAVNLVRDREPITWDMLRLTLLRPQEFVYGKLQGTLRLLWPLFGPVYLIDCLYLLVMAFSFGSRDSYFWTYAFTAELTLLPLHLGFIVTASMLAASFTRSVPTSVAAAYAGTMICTLLFLYLQLQILSEFAGPGWGEMTGLIVFHGASCIFALFIGIGITIARFEAIWNMGIPTSGQVPDSGKAPPSP